MRARAVEDLQEGDEALGNFVAEVSPAVLSFYFVISFFVTNSMVQLAFPGSLASFDRRMSETGLVKS